MKGKKTVVTLVATFSLAAAGYAAAHGPAGEGGFGRKDVPPPPPPPHHHHHPHPKGHGPWWWFFDNGWD